MDIQEMHKKPPYGMIAILFIGAFISIFNNTLINIALPSIMVEFEINSTTVQWLATGYMLVNGILIPASAFFIQRFENRKIFIAAMSLFVIGTIFAATAPAFSFLLVGRMTQAAGSAIMMPLLMNVMLTAFPIEKRGTAMGVFGMVMIVAPAIGPTLSGYIIEHYEWRMLFYFVLPLAVIPLILGIFKLKNITPQNNIKLDFLSLLLSSIAFGCILFGFSSAGDPEIGWASPKVYLTLIIGTISLIIFIFRQFKLDEPLLEFSIYKYPMFALSSIISMVIAISMFSGMILTPIYVQTIRGISPMDAGLLMLPGAIVMGIMSPITGRLFDKYGPKALSLLGLGIAVVTTYYFSKLTMDSGYFYLMMLYTFRMFGFSMISMPIMTNGMNELPMEMNPHGTAINNTLQQVSGAIGTALLVSVMNARMESTATELVAQATKEAAQTGAQPSAEAMAALEQTITNTAMLDGITHAFFVSTIIAGLAFVLALFIKRVTPKTVKI